MLAKKFGGKDGEGAEIDSGLARRERLGRRGMPVMGEHGLGAQRVYFVIRRPVGSGYTTQLGEGVTNDESLARVRIVGLVRDETHEHICKRRELLKFRIRLASLVGER